MVEKFTDVLKNELFEFNLYFKKSLKSSVKKFDEVLDYIFTNTGKQIRPILGILLAKTIGEFNEEQKKFLAAIECIHNATLFHDDVIDNSEIRRNQDALHKKFSNKTAILAGDYFLTVGIKNIYSLENNRINKLVADYMKKICEGEIEQNLTLYELLPLGKYLEKTKNKTALLFELTALGISILSENHKYQANLKNFGENFGLAFQIKDDLKNFQKFNNKPVLNDLKSGVITAPVIFLAQDNQDVKSLLKQKKYSQILSLIKNSDALNQTENLTKKYIYQAIENIADLPNNEYKKLLTDLLSEF